MNLHSIKTNRQVGLLVIVLFQILTIRLSYANKPTSLSATHISTHEINKQLALADQVKRSDPALFKELLTKLREHPNKQSEQKFLLDFLIAYDFVYSGKFEKAKAKLLELLSSNASSLIKYRANYAMIIVSTAMKNWGDGLNYVSKNIQQLPSIRNSELFQNGLVTTIIFYSQMGQYNLALKYIKEFSEQSLSAKNSCILGQLSLEAQFNLDKLEPNSILIDNAIEICEQADVKIALNIIYLHKAKLHIQAQNANVALAILLKQLNAALSTNYPMLIAEFKNTIANAYWQLNNIHNAKKHALDALSVNTNMSNLLQGVDTYYLLYQIAKAENNPSLALEYYEKYAEIEKANLEGEKAKHLAFQLAQHQATEQKNQIALLNEKNTLLETKQALSEAEVANTRLVIGFLIVSLILITLWGGRFYKAHKRIKELAEYDALTGIFNRGHFTHVANSALKYCQNAEQDLSVIIFDLDNFKSVNDSYGHATGDWALKEATKVCKNLGRQNDIFARLGGEEFCILLPSCNIRSAALRAEECRHAIEDIITEASGHDFRITASFGVTDAKTSGFNLEKLLADADEAAYTSKHSGRNRVTVYEVETTPKQAQLDGSWSIT